MGERVAVVGAGCAGLTAAYLLRQAFDVTLFEQGDHLGGHAHTFVVPSGPDRGLALDLGFMVMNRRTYPLFYRLLEELGIDDLGGSEMSFGYWEPASGFQYAINWDQGAPHAPPGDLLALLPGILRFQREAARALAASLDPRLTLGRFLERQRPGADVVDRYVIPMASAIWSTEPARIRDFPAATLLRFLENHGLLSLDEAPRWQHVGGGSRRYVEALVASLPAGTVSRRRVCAVVRGGDAVELAAADGERQRFSRVVLACHADEALALLRDATPDEARALSAWSYQRNAGVLHSDASALPSQPGSWASWNVARRDGALSVTYHLNRLQGHSEANRQYFLEFNSGRPMDESNILLRAAFTHPVYGPDSIGAQERLRGLNRTGRVLFCGSYMGHGFHEDAVRSAHDVARALGAPA